MRIAVTSVASLIILCSTALSSDRSSQLVGRWIRPNITGIGDQQEGFTLRSNGTGEFIGMHSMRLVSWKIKEDDLILVRNSERYPQPTLATYTFAHTPDGRLTIHSRQGDYLDGAYTKDTGGKAIPPRGT